MRIIAYDVLDYLVFGITSKEIHEDFLYLTADDIQACSSYATDRQRQLMAVQI